MVQRFPVDDKMTRRTCWRWAFWGGSPDRRAKVTPGPIGETSPRRADRTGGWRGLGLGTERGGVGWECGGKAGGCGSLAGGLARAKSRGNDWTAGRGLPI